MKQIRHTLLKAFLILLTSLPASGVFAANKFTASDGNTYTWTANNDGTNTATITGVNSINNNDLMIPSTITRGKKTYTVTEIGSEAFMGNTSLTSITIPSNVIYIGVAAFRGCTNVKTININPSPNLQIGYAAFCTDNIDFWGNITSKGTLEKVIITSSTPPSLVYNLIDLLEGLNIPYFSSDSKMFVPDATDGAAETSTQYKYKQTWSDYSSQIYKYFDKSLAGSYNDYYYGTLALPYTVEIPSV